jgi:hypothetical protein
MKKHKTIIMLSAKRCGSTAMFRVFQKHPDVGVCHVDKSIGNWEPNFWNYAYRAINGNPEQLIKQLGTSHPGLKINTPLDTDRVFDLWGQILEQDGPVVFDKTPKYLAEPGTFELLRQYMDAGNDVRIFGMIRDPRDAITSQYTKWNRIVVDDHPDKRMKKWLKWYGLFEKVQTAFDQVPLFRYEDFATAPVCYAPMIFKHVGVRHIPDAYSHIRPTHVGRYKRTRLKALKEWKYSEEFIAHLKKYGYVGEDRETVGTIRKWINRFTGRN